MIMGPLGKYTLSNKRSPGVFEKRDEELRICYFFLKSVKKLIDIGWMVLEINRCKQQAFYLNYLRFLLKIGLISTNATNERIAFSTNQAILI